MCVWSADLGLYLFAPSDKSNTETEGKEKADADKEKDEELPTVHFIVVGLWFWWREVVFISLLTAFLFHLVVTRQVTIHFFSTGLILVG